MGDFVGGFFIGKWLNRKPVWVQIVCCWPVAGFLIWIAVVAPRVWWALAPAAFALALPFIPARKDDDATG